jgi:hypothetical protein
MGLEFSIEFIFTALLLRWCVSCDHDAAAVAGVVGNNSRTGFARRAQHAHPYHLWQDSHQYDQTRRWR